MSIERNKAVARRWHEAWGTDAITAAYAECLASDFKALFFEQGWLDRDTYILHDQAFAAAFSDTRISVEESVAEGEIVMSRMTWCGRHTGAFQGIPVTGKQFEIMDFAVDRFRSWCVIEHVPLFDQFSLLQQLDVLPGLKPAEPDQAVS
jgi:predicted ester cyclase